MRALLMAAGLALAAVPALAFHGLHEGETGRLQFAYCVEETDAHAVLDEYAESGAEAATFAMIIRKTPHPIGLLACGAASGPTTIGPLIRSETAPDGETLYMIKATGHIEGQPAAIYIITSTPHIAPGQAS